MSATSEIQKRLIVEMDALLNPQDHVESERIKFLCAELHDDKIWPVPPSDNGWPEIQGETYLFVPAGIFQSYETMRKVSETFEGATPIGTYHLEMPVFKANDVDTVLSIDSASDAAAYLLREDDIPVVCGHPIANNHLFPEPMVLVDLTEITSELVFLSPVCIEIDGLALPIVFGASRMLPPSGTAMTFIVKYGFWSSIFDGANIAEPIAAFEIATGLPDAYQFAFNPNDRHGHNVLSQIAEIAQTYYVARRTLQGRMYTPKANNDGDNGGADGGAGGEK